jgi:hypothetical protein
MDLPDDAIVASKEAYLTLIDYVEVHTLCCDDDIWFGSNTGHDGVVSCACGKKYALVIKVVEKVD